MIKVDTNHLVNQAQKMQSIAQQLNEIAAGVASANRALNWNTSIDEKIRKALNNCNASITRLDETASKLGTVLNTTATKYEQTEQKNKQDKALPAVSGVIGAAEKITTSWIDRDGDGKPDSNVIKPPVIDPEIVKDVLDDIMDPDHTGTTAPGGVITGAAGVVTEAINNIMDRNGDGKPDSNVIDIPTPGGIAKDAIEVIRDQMKTSADGTSDSGVNTIKVAEPAFVIDRLTDNEGQWQPAVEGADAVIDFINRNHGHNPGDLIFPEEFKPPATGVLDRVEEIFEQFFDSDGSGSVFRGGGGRSSGGGSTRSF